MSLYVSPGNYVRVEALGNVRVTTTRKKGWCMSHADADRTEHVALGHGIIKFVSVKITWNLLAPALT